MKFANKLMIVPYNYSFEAPLKNYLSSLDQEMNDVLNQKIPDDQKVKLYNSILVKYKSSYDPIVYENQPANIEAITSLIEDVKKETKELDQDLKDQYSNLNVKLEQIYDDKDYVKKKVKKDLMNKSVSNAKMTKIKSDKREIKKAKRRLTTINDDETKVKKNKTEDNESSMEIEENNILDTALNNTKPLTTRKEQKEYEEARLKAQQNIVNSLTQQQEQATQNSESKIQQKQSTKTNKKQQNGNGKIKWSTKKFF